MGFFSLWLCRQCLQKLWQGRWWSFDLEHFEASLSKRKMGWWPTDAIWICWTQWLGERCQEQADYSGRCILPGSMARSWQSRRSGSWRSGARGWCHLTRRSRWRSEAICCDSRIWRSESFEIGALRLWATVSSRCPREALCFSSRARYTRSGLSFQGILETWSNGVKHAQDIHKSSSMDPCLLRKAKRLEKRNRKRSKSSKSRGWFSCGKLHFSAFFQLKKPVKKSLKFLSGHTTTTIIIILTLNSSGSQRLRKACCPGWSIPQWWAFTANICN